MMSYLYAHFQAASKGFVYKKLKQYERLYIFKNTIIEKILGRSYCFIFL